MCTENYVHIGIMSIPEILAENLRARRGDLTLEAFAKKLGVSRPTLSRLEGAAQNTTLKTLEQIAKSLRCDVFELLKEPAGRKRG